MEGLTTTRHKFNVKLLGQEGSEVAALKPPFDVVTVFGRFGFKGRVPVKGTINGFPFRSSLKNMGGGHMMAVYAQLSRGAHCRAGDIVSVVMELDDEKRTLEVPAYLRRMIEGNRKARESWSKLSSTDRKEYVRGIEGAKEMKTREKRIAAMMDALRAGERKK